jgi:hypothetical protein
MIGLTAAGAAMAGDPSPVSSSGVSTCRRAAGALGLDQILESLLPMLAGLDALSLTAVDIAIGVGMFFAGELALSRLLFRAYRRDEPY